MDLYDLSAFSNGSWQSIEDEKLCSKPGRGCASSGLTRISYSYLHGHPAAWITEH